MNRIWRGIRYIGQPRVRHAIGLAYLLGLTLSIAVAWAIAAFGRLAPATPSLAAFEDSELRTVGISRSAISLKVEVSKDVVVNWSPEQTVGEPNTWNMGDITTAWASLAQDNQDEWLELEYLPAIVAQRVIIHETYNPGAVSRIVAIDASGAEEILWTGNDPAVLTPKGIFVAEIPLSTPKSISRLRLHLDSKRVAGWNEIDAVGLVNAAGTIQWATAARASSTYATTQGTGSALTFAELARSVPYWVEPDAYRYGLNWITYEAHGWPFLAMYGQNPDASGARVPLYPWWPIWPGLLADAAVYGALLMVMYTLATAPRRFLRESVWLRRGCCMQCGYDLQFDLIRGCPECGWRRESTKEQKRVEELERKHREGYERYPVQKDEFIDAD